MTSSIWRESLFIFLELWHSWSNFLNANKTRITKLKKHLKYLSWIKSCGLLKFEFPAILLLKIAPSLKFNSPQLLTAIRYFKNVFRFDILLAHGFSLYDQPCRSSKNRFSRQIDDVILPPKKIKFKNLNRPSCREDTVLSYCKVWVGYDKTLRR